MKKKVNENLSGKSFWIFLAQKEQKIEITIYCAFFVILFLILKRMYPYPDGISDSGAYIAAALKGTYDGFRPYGYSGFLNAMKGISNSISFVIFIQYFFHAFTSILFLLTVKYFFNPKKKYIYYLFVIVSLCSLTSIYLTNAILSDSIFASLTVCWIVLNIWFIYTQSKARQLALLVTKFLLLYFLVSVRFTGVFYFMVEFMLIFFILYRKQKALLAASSLALILIYYSFYKKQVEATEKISQIEAFSGFSGWQLANNALHVLPYIKLNAEDLKGKPFEKFAFYAKSKDSLVVDATEERTCTHFMWIKEMPLKQYMFREQQKTKWYYIKEWTYLGKNVYGEFGKYIILNYPWMFFKHFLLPNSLSVFHPKYDQLYKKYNEKAIPSHVLKDYYSISKDQRFHSNSCIIANCSKAFANYRLVLWILLFILIIVFIINKGWKKIQKKQLNMALFILAFVLGYAAFHIFIATLELRYIVPIHLCQTFLLYVGIYSLVKKEDNNEAIAN